MTSFSEFIKEGKGSHIEFAGDQEEFSSWDKPDSFYYHITIKRNVKKLFVTDWYPTPKGPCPVDGIGNILGKLFFCDRNGVSYWANVIERHLEHESDDTIPKLAVIRFPKSFVKDAQYDEVGTKDSCANAFYVNHPIKNADDL